MVRLVAFLVLLGVVFIAQGQVKTDTLSSVTISAQRQLLPVRGTQTISDDILNRYTQKSLQQVLDQHSNVFIKNYGVSNMSTISIRGSSAAQTAVLWQGININNAMTGLSDFSLLPVSLFNTVEVAYGSRPNNSGISGAIILETKRPEWYRQKTKWQAGAGWESLQNGSFSIGHTKSWANFYNQFRVVHTQGQNRYAFENPYIPRRDTLEHSAMRSTHVLNNFFFVAGRHEVAWHTWWQTTRREIPPTAFEEQSDAAETIRSFRNVFTYQYKAPFNTTYRGKMGFIFDDYLYTYPLLSDPMPAQSWQVPAELSIEKVSGVHRMSAQGTMTLQAMQVPQIKRLNRLGINGSYRYRPERRAWDVFAKFQYEHGSWFKVKPAASLMVQYTVPSQYNSLKNISFYGTAYTAYRLPTLNELFYQPGGNVDLKPEQSRNIEGGFEFKKNKPRWQFSTNWATYYRWVDQWIVWFGSSILTPHNVLQVNSRGVEGRVEAQWYTRKLPKKEPWFEYIDEVQIAHVGKANQSVAHIPLLVLDAHYAYTLSTTAASAIPNDYSVGKQLPYVPRYQVKINPGIRYRAWALHYQFQYTGYRFTTTDESNWLTPFAVSGIQIRNQIAFGSGKGRRLDWQIGCQNLFNRTYESMVGRIMPGRNLALQVQWQWP